MSGQDFTIEEFRSEYVVSGRSDVAKVRAHLDRLIPRAAEECEKHLDDTSGTIVVIEHLDVDAFHDLSASDALVIREWGLALTGAIRRALEGPAGAGIARFPDEVAYLAAFLDDVVRGGTSSSWKYPSLASFRLGTRSATIAAALAHHATKAWRVLCHLHRQGRFEALCEGLTEDHASVIERSLVPSAPPAVWSDEGITTIGSMAPRIWPLLDRPLTLPVNWIRMMVWLAADHPRTADHPSAAFLAAEALRIGERAEGRYASQASSRDRLGAAAPSLETRPPVPVRTRLARAVLARSVRGRAAAGRRSASPASARAAFAEPDEDGSSRVVVTSVGGFFLLIRGALEGGIVSHLSHLPSSAGIAGDRLGLYLLALALSGPRVRQVRRDPGAALFAGLDASPAPDVLERAVAAMDPAILFDKPATGDLAGAVVPHEDGPVLIVRDGAGEWQFAARVPDRDAAAAALDEAERLLGCAVSLGPWAGDPTVLRDVSHLFAVRSAEVPERVHAALTVTARRLLTRFARRLSGFAESSVPYLMTNFLFGPSTIQIDDETVGVTLPRTPLQVVLRLYGAGEVAFVPWLAGRRLAFTFP